MGPWRRGCENRPNTNNVIHEHSLRYIYNSGTMSYNVLLQLDYTSIPILVKNVYKISFKFHSIF